MSVVVSNFEVSFFWSKKAKFGKMSLFSRIFKQSLFFRHWEQFVTKKINQNWEILKRVEIQFFFDLNRWKFEIRSWVFLFFAGNKIGFEVNRSKHSYNKRSFFWRYVWIIRLGVKKFNFIFIQKNIFTISPSILQVRNNRFRPTILYKKYKKIKFSQMR